MSFILKSDVKVIPALQIILCPFIKQYVAIFQVYSSAYVHNENLHKYVKSFPIVVTKIKLYFWKWYLFI